MVSGRNFLTHRRAHRRSVFSPISVEGIQLELGTTETFGARISVEGIQLELGTTETFGARISLEGIQMELGTTETFGARVSVEGIQIELGTTVVNPYSGLLVHYAMDSGASTNQLDLAGRISATLTQNGGVGSTTGKVGNCHTFDGSNDYLSGASNSSFQLVDNARTWAGWFYLGNKTNTQTLFAKHDGTASTSEYRLIYNQSTDRFEFEICNGSTVTTAQASTFGSPSTSTWYFVVCEHDPSGDQISIAVNNGSANTASVAGGSNSTSLAFTVGGNASGAVLLTGRVDELAIWDRLLTANEKTVLYSSGNGLALSSYQTI